MKRVLTWALAWAMAGSVAQAEEISVGFRADAPPFSLDKAGPNGEYSGFLADLCYAALERSEFQLRAVRVKAGERFDKLRLGGQEPGGIDLLCDPTSVQVSILDEFILSPIVFATGVGYLRKQDPGRAGGNLRVGFLGGTTAQTAVEIALRTEAIKVVEGYQLEKIIVSDHFEGVRKVCSGEIEFYFGDLDILRALRAREATCEDVTDSQQTFSYEAYALAVNAKRPDIALALQAGIYRAFSDGTAAALYDLSFPDQTRSNVLQALFAMNGVLPCNAELKKILGSDPCRAPRPSVGQ